MKQNGMICMLKQYFCRHDFKRIAKNKDVNESLWQCTKCNVFSINHDGIGISYICKYPNIGGWVKV